MWGRPSEECLAKDRVMSANGDFQDFKKKARERQSGKGKLLLSRNETTINIVLYLAHDDCEKTLPL